MLLLLSALLFQFQPVDTGLPRSGQWRHGFAVADMNGDGRPDLAFSSPRKQPGPPVIFLNQGGGRWSRWQAKFPPLPFDYGAVAAADFDGNGANDLAIASHYRGLAVVLGDGRGNFAPSQEGLALRVPSPPFTSRTVVATDWNGDGLVDIAALSDGPRPGDPTVRLGVTVFENLGYAWKGVRAAGTDVVFGDAIAVGDVDGDRLPDLVTASNNTADRRVLRLGADGELARRELPTVAPATTIHAIDLHDFDGDGRDEIAVAYGSSLDLVSFPSGAQRLWSGPGRIAAVAAGDLNGDGAGDVVAATDDGRLLTFRGTTPDAELATPAWRRGCSPFGLRLADLDGDRRDEIIAGFAGDSAACTSGGGVEVWRTVPAKRRRAASH